MKRIFVFLYFVLFISVFTSFSQNVTGTKANSRDNNPSKKYLRPSLTVIYADRGNDRSQRMMRIVNASPVPGKFNDHNIAIRSVKVSGDFVRPALTEALNNEVSRQVVAKWFNRNSKGEFNMDLIGDRGMYNANDADVIRAQNSQRKMDLLRDAGENLLDRSYILVYDMKNILTTDEYYAKRGMSTDREGYIATYDCYLFKLDWNDSIASIFYNTMWNDASSPSMDKVGLFNKSTFPVKYVTTVSTAFGTISSTQFKDHSKNIFGSMSDDELFAGLWRQVTKETDISLAQANEDFKVKTPVFSTHPVAAKIGLKEDLSVDRRFFVYEMQLDKNGQKVAKRKGVVRAGSYISDNRRTATGRSDTSIFYQVSGRRIYEGMLMQENPDWGFGITAGYASQNGAIGEGIFGNVEISLSLWAGKAGISLSPGIKAYGNFALALDSLNLKNPLGNNVSYSYSVTSWAAGLSKDIYFLKNFVLVPYAGYGQETYVNMDSNADKDKYMAEYIQAGAKLGINITYNVQLMGNANVNAIINSKPNKNEYTGFTDDTKDIMAEKLKDSRENIQYSVGLRILF